MWTEIIWSSFLVCIVYVIIKYVYHLSELKDYPPGPFPLPVIGNLHLISPSKPYVSFANLGEIYGDVFSVSFGTERIVIVNTIEPAKEALIRKGKTFAGRPTNIYPAEIFSRGYRDIGFADYSPRWSMLRKHYSSSMKMYGESLEKFDTLVVEESKKLHERIRKYKESPVTWSDEIGLSILNVISFMIFGKRYEPNDPDLHTTMEWVKLAFEGLGNSQIVVVLPWLRFFPIECLRNLKKAIRKRDQQFRKELTEHRETYDKSFQRDLTDSLLKLTSEANIEKTLGLACTTNGDIEMMITDVYVGGVDTVATVLQWCIMYLLHWPQYQDRIYNEITSIAGTDELPSSCDYSKFHYVNAVVYETLRYCSPAPLAFTHKALEKSSIQGLSVPKSASIIFNVWNMHYDENYWDNPNDFRPERWLNENGEFTSYQNISFLPFSTGRRVCLGQHIAKRQLVLFLSRLIKEFEIVNAPNVPLPSFEGKLGITLKPVVSYKCVFQPRKPNNI